MAYSPFAQAPKSTILQRSLQNGRKALLGENSAKLPHFGQATKRFLVVCMVYESYVELAACYGCLTASTVARLG